MSDEEDAEVLALTPGPLVLVVDDELTPRSIIRRMVRALGYPARSCRSGREALRFMETHPQQVRLLMADVGMPRMDGGELAERALDMDPGLRVVLMAGPSDANSADILAGYRDLPFLAKPVTFGELFNRLEELVGPPAHSPGFPPVLTPPRSRQRRRPSGQHQR
jgi:CheY-like chemotaxis protein